MPGRTYPPPGAVGQYKYSHNGQLKDNEVFEGALSAEFWEYDSRIGRRWEIDPITHTWESPYACFSNNPVVLSDVNGDADDTKPKGKSGKTAKRFRQHHKKAANKNKKGDGPSASQGKGKQNSSAKNNHVNDKKGGGGAKPTAKKLEAKKIQPTVYLYKVRTHSTEHTKFEGDKDLTDFDLKNKIAPEVSRILNNNLLNTPINVKVITEEEAQKITMQQLLNEKSAIVPIVRTVLDGAIYSESSLGQSDGNGGVNPDPNLTYVAYWTARNTTGLGVTTNYFVSYLIAHEALHQFHKMSSNSKSFHTNSYINLNQDGSYINANSFKTKINMKDLKNTAEWIPASMQIQINNWLKSKPIKP